MVRVPGFLLSPHPLNVTNHKVSAIAGSTAPPCSEILTQHLVFRLKEKDKKELVLRKQVLQHRSRGERSICCGWTRGWTHICLQTPRAAPGYKDTTLACCHPHSLPARQRRKSQARRLLNRVISQQLVQQDIHRVLPRFHLYKTQPPGNSYVLDSICVPDYSIWVIRFFLFLNIQELHSRYFTN